MAGKVALIERFSDCESLLVAIKSWASLSSTTLFTVVPDFPEKYSSKSLLYWLDYCDVQDVDIIVLFPSSLPEASPLQQECSYDSYVKFYSIATSISSNIIYHLDDYIKAVYRTNSAMHISYFVGGHYDDAELSSELKQHRVMTAHISTLLNESVNRLQLEYTSLNFALLQKHARNTKVHAIFTSKFHLKTSSVAPLTSDMSLLADGSIYVYIFVCDIHLHLAQHYVHRLKWSCDVKETCHMVLEYHIHSVFCHVTNTDISHAKPSIYGALLELECLLKDNNQDLDYIYLLVGLDALWSFPQPSKPNENSYIPSMEYGKITIMPILSPIVLPALHSNMTAMVGQTMFMSRFLMDIKECLRYYEDDSAHYQICIRELQIALHHIVAFDEDARVFQFNSSYRDIFAASSSEVDALGQLETVDSKHELYENSMLFDTYDLFPYGDFLNESVVDTILQYLEQQHSQSAISQQVIDVVAATVRFEFIDHGEWFSAIYTIWTVVQFILSRKECLEEHIDPLALRLAEVGGVLFVNANQVGGAHTDSFNSICR
ncbi:hypothetical protein EON65_04165 [archaeon]|nr:MAG: hypothetical protein EON65_04165 [archaeon]